MTESVISNQNLILFLGGALLSTIGILVAFIIATHRREMDLTREELKEIREELRKLRERLHLLINQRSPHNPLPPNGSN